jgi:hypothetical protein
MQGRMKSDRREDRLSLWEEGGKQCALFCLLACSGADRGMISHWQDRMGLGASPSHSRPRCTMWGYGFGACFSLE